MKSTSDTNEFKPSLSEDLLSSPILDLPPTEATVAGMKRGRPRDKAAHKAIIDCTRRMAHEKVNYKDITVEGISKESKVSKTTIYRWWEHKAELVREACLLGRFPCPDTGALEGDLQDLVRQEIRVQTTCASRPVFAGLVAGLIAISDAAEVKKPCPYQAERYQVITQIFNNAIARGEWSGEFDLEATYETLFSMIFYRYIGLKKTFDEKQITRLANRILQEANPDK